MKLLVCGSREWDDYDRLSWMLDRIAATNDIEVVIHGAQRGADRMAGVWAEKRGIAVDPHPARWEAYPPAERWRAGHDRNVEMLGAGPDFVLGFKVGFDWTLRKGGTENMIGLARSVGVPCLVVGR